MAVERAIERALEGALEVLEQELAATGVPLIRALATVELPNGAAVSARRGLASAEDELAWLLALADAVARPLGLRVKVKGKGLFG